MAELTVIQVVSSNLTLIKCNRCNGTGDNNREHFCHVCGGKGSLAIRHQGPLIPCARCQGTGENSREHFCRVCGGCGAVPAYGEWEHLLQGRPAVD